MSDVMTREDRLILYRQISKALSDYLDLSKGDRDQILSGMSKFYGVTEPGGKCLLLGRVAEKDRMKMKGNPDQECYYVQPLYYPYGSPGSTFLSFDNFGNYKDTYFVPRETEQQVGDLGLYSVSIYTEKKKISLKLHRAFSDEDKKVYWLERLEYINDRFETETARMREQINLSRLQDIDQYSYKAASARSDLKYLEETAGKTSKILEEYERVEAIRPEIEKLISSYDDKLRVIGNLKGKEREKAAEQIQTEFNGHKLSDTDDIIGHVSAFISGRGFSYSTGERVIRRFVSALLTDQIIILSGPPGTGKTSLPELVADSIGAGFTRIPVQSNWTDAQDLTGFYDYKEDRYVSTPFLDALIRAAEDPERIHIILLDEMNIARIEYYFSMFLSSMDRKDEDSKRMIPLFSGEKEVKTTSGYSVSPMFAIPDNVQFVGTVNMDETTNKPSPKVLNRSYVIEIGYAGSEEDAEAGSQSPAQLKPSVLMGIRSGNTGSEEEISKIEEAVRMLNEQYEVSYSSRNRKKASLMLASGADADDIVLGMVLPGIRVSSKPAAGTSAALPADLINSRAKLEDMRDGREPDYWRY